MLLQRVIRPSPFKERKSPLPHLKNDKNVNDECYRMQEEQESACAVRLSVLLHAAAHHVHMLLELQRLQRGCDQTCVHLTVAAAFENFEEIVKNFGKGFFVAAFAVATVTIVSAR
jgi:hypothetical protein